MRSYRIIEYDGDEAWVTETLHESLSGRCELPSGSGRFLTARTVTGAKEEALARRLLHSMRKVPGTWRARKLDQDPKLIVTVEEAIKEQRGSRWP